MLERSVKSWQLQKWSINACKLSHFNFFCQDKIFTRSCIALRYKGGEEQEISHLTPPCKKVSWKTKTCQQKRTAITLTCMSSSNHIIYYGNIKKSHMLYLQVMRSPSPPSSPSPGLPSNQKGICLRSQSSHSPSCEMTQIASMYGTLQCASHQKAILMPKQPTKCQMDRSPTFFVLVYWVWLRAKLFSNWWWFPAATAFASQSYPMCIYTYKCNLL